jgi:hypothetical protein
MRPATTGKPTPRICAGEVANKVLAETGDEGRAVRIANATVAKARRSMK